MRTYRVQSPIQLPSYATKMPPQVKQKRQHKGHFERILQLFVRAGKQWHTMAALFPLTRTASQFHWWCSHQFQYAPEGGIISLWTVRPQFHRPHQRTTKIVTNRLPEQSVKLPLLALRQRYFH